MLFLIAALLQDADLESRLKLVQSFIDGSAEARDRIVEAGPPMLPALANARVKHKESPRLPALEELIREVRGSGEVSPFALEAWTVAERVRIAKDLTVRENGGVLLLKGSVCVVVDPALRDAVRFTREWLEARDGRPVLDALEALAREKDLDVDYRHGALWLGSVERLWGVPKADPIPALRDDVAAAAQKQLPALGSESPEERDAAADAIAKLGPAVIPLLEARAKDADRETAGRCRDLIERLRPRPRLVGAAPVRNAWASQELKAEADRRVANQLRSMKLDVDHEKVTLAKMAAWLTEWCGFTVRVEGAADLALAIQQKDLLVESLIEQITLPRGLDARVEKGEVVIFQRP
jgi:hypothetical protein